MSRRTHQFSLLGWGDATRSPAKSLARTHPHLDKHYDLSLPHDEINLTKAAAIVAFYQKQPLTLKVRFGILLTFPALKLAPGIWHLH